MLKETIGAVGGNTNNNYVRIEMSFNSLMTGFFEGSNIDELIQRILAHIKAQVENPPLHESGFTLNQIVDLHINFHKR